MSERADERADLVEAELDADLLEREERRARRGIVRHGQRAR
jgi:hypothetical protein